MKIQLTQAEVKAAIAAYVSGTIGIDLRNNDLAITFSATRHEGVIANLETTPKAFVGTASQLISGTAGIPGYSDSTVQATAALGDNFSDLGHLPATGETVAVAAEEPAVDPVDAALAEDTAAPVEAAETPAVAEIDTDTDTKPVEAETKPVKSTATLFGKPASA